MGVEQEQKNEVIDSALEKLEQEEKAEKDLTVRDFAYHVRNVARKVGGCGACPFLETHQCPFFPEVRRDKFYNDGCGCVKFLSVVKIVGGGEYPTVARTKQYTELFKDGMIKDWLLLKFKENPEGFDKDRMQQLYQWSAHIAESVAKIRKQEEGSKLTVKRGVSPSDVLAAVRLAESKERDGVLEADFTSSVLGDDDEA